MWGAEAGGCAAVPTHVAARRYYPAFWSRSEMAVLRKFAPKFEQVYFIHSAFGVEQKGSVRDASTWVWAQTRGDACS